MSFYEDQEEDWIANGCKGSPSDYYAGEIAPWADKSHFNPGMSVMEIVAPGKPSKSARRNAQRKRARARKLQAKEEAR